MWGILKEFHQFSNLFPLFFLIFLFLFFEAGRVGSRANSSKFRQSSYYSNRCTVCGILPPISAASVDLNWSKKRPSTFDCCKSTLFSFIPERLAVLTSSFSCNKWFRSSSSIFIDCHMVALWELGSRFSLFSSLIREKVSILITFLENEISYNGCISLRVSSNFSQSSKLRGVV